MTIAATGTRRDLMIHEQKFPRLTEILFRNPRRDPRDLAAQVERQLCTIVRHAYEHVPAYRRRWEEAGFDPQPFAGLCELPSIPTVDKNYIVASGADARDGRVPLDDLHEMNTSGTSGCAIKMFRTTRELRVTRRAYLRTLMRAGGRPWHRVVTVCSPWLQSKRGMFVKNVIKTAHVLPLDSMEKQVDLVLSFKPKGIVGQTGGLYLLARELLRRGIRLSLTFVGPTGSTLMPIMAQTMKEAFGASPCDLYGAIELGGISWQCRRGNYHVDSDRVVVEIVDESGRPVPRGTQGKVVCTSLYNYTMPMIRYQLLDIAALSTRTCDCGCRFPLMEPVQGRVNDYLPAPGGELISPHFFFHLFDHAGSVPVKEWRIIQHDLDRLTYEYIPEDSFNPQALQAGMDMIRTRFGQRITLNVKQVQEMPVSATGKRTCIISELRPDDESRTQPWIRPADDWGLGLSGRHTSNMDLVGVKGPRGATL